MLKMEVIFMRVICIYCGILCDLIEPFDDDREIQGICDECYEISKRNLENGRRCIK